MDSNSGKRTRSKTPSTMTIESTPVQGTPPPKTKAKITVPRADEVKIIDGPLKLGDVADLALKAMTKVQNCEVNVCGLKEYNDVSKEMFEYLTTKIEKLENRINHMEDEMANVTRFLEKQFPIDEVPPVVAEAHAVAAEALAVVPPIAAVAHAGAVDRVYDTFLNANKKQHDLPLLPTESMTKLKGATVRNGWDGKFPPPKSLAYNGAHLCCFTCRKVLTNFWTSKKGTKWVSCYKKNNDDMLEGCVNILSEANYDFVMSHIDEITTESVA